MSRSEYRSTLESLYALEAAKGMDFKLERVALALRNLGDPHTKFRSIHIAGTNGKGSVAAMLHSMFGAGGYRVGLYTSPHLVDFRERIRVGAEQISADEVVTYARQVHAAATVHGIQLTFFEFVTVLAFLHFAGKQVDVAVVEVGLGGRLDATNVIDPELSVITTISLDHEEYLGESIASIAAEKGGIIKSKRPVILGDVVPEAAATLETIASDRGAAVRRLGKDFWIDGDIHPTYRSVRGEVGPLCIALRGSHQRRNAAVAVAAVEGLQHLLPLSTEAICNGLREVRWPGRLEVVGHHPVMVLDGAHNQAGVETLVRELPALVDGRRTYLLFGVMRDKRWRPMVELLAPLMDGVVVVRAERSRGEDPDQLAKAFAPHCQVWTEEAPAAGLVRARQLAGDDGAIVVAGSLFLVGAVHPHLNLHSPELDATTSSADARP